MHLYIILQGRGSGLRSSHGVRNNKKGHNIVAYFSETYDLHNKAQIDIYRKVSQVRFHGNTETYREDGCSSVAAFEYTCRRAPPEWHSTAADKIAAATVSTI